jgi:hypothetical protein
MMGALKLNIYPKYIKNNATITSVPIKQLILQEELH